MAPQKRLDFQYHSVTQYAFAARVEVHKGSQTDLGRILQ